MSLTFHFRCTLKCSLQFVSIWTSLKLGGSITTFVHVDLDCALLQKPVSEKHYLREVRNSLDWFVTQCSLHLYN